jgi:predicted nuclease of predicted toxin-antitoxin system
VKLLLDENIDEAFCRYMPNHEVHHVSHLGWQGTKNGELLAKAADAVFEAFITADKGMPHQQSMKGRPYPLIVLDIHPNILENQVICVPMIEERLSRADAGEVYVIDGPHPKRRGR